MVDDRIQGKWLGLRANAKISDSLLSSLFTSEVCMGIYVFSLVYKIASYNLVLARRMMTHLLIF